jgi:tRNA threonylcarbamoyladenosine biosynthesis protein TsaE
VNPPASADASGGTEGVGAADADERMLVTPDAASTRRLGAALASVAEPGDVICLLGDLGAGKSELARGFGAGLGVTETMASPSFVLMLEHEGRLPLFHIDLYRLADAADAAAGGLLDERQRDGVTLIEWAERLGTELPAERLEVRIDGSGDDPRTIRIRATAPRYRRYLEAAA